MALNVMCDCISDMVYRQRTPLHLDGTSGLRGTGDHVNECLQPHPCAAVFDEHGRML